MISNLFLLFLAIAKVSLLTALGLAITAAILFEKFGTGALRPEQSESGHVLGSNPRFVSDSLSASFNNSGDGQLAARGLMPTPLNLATSPSRKVVEFPRFGKKPCKAIPARGERKA